MAILENGLTAADDADVDDDEMKPPPKPPEKPTPPTPPLDGVAAAFAMSANVKLDLEPNMVSIVFNVEDPVVLVFGGVKDDDDDAGALLPNDWNRFVLPNAIFG